MKNTLQDELNCKVLEEMGVQTFLKMNGVEEVGAVDMKMNKIPLENHKTMVHNSHFILPNPSLNLSHSPPQKVHPSYPTSKLPEYKSLDNMRNITQQSIAPTKKTVILSQPVNGGGIC